MFWPREIFCWDRIFFALALLLLYFLVIEFAGVSSGLSCTQSLLHGDPYAALGVTRNPASCPSLILITSRILYPGFLLVLPRQIPEVPRWPLCSRWAATSCFDRMSPDSGRKRRIKPEIAIQTEITVDYSVSQGVQHVCSFQRDQCLSRIQHRFAVVTH